MKAWHMTIKKKLYLTYMTGIASTVLLMFLVSGIFHGGHLLPSRHDPDPENAMSYTFQFKGLNSVEEAARVLNGAVLRLKASGDQGFLKSEAFWNEIDQSFRHNVSLVVFQEGLPFYTSEKLPQNLDYTLFPAFGEVAPYPNTYLFETHETVIQRQVDYIAEDGDNVTVFLLFSVASQVDKLFVMALNNILLFILISTCIMGVVSWYVVRSITVPLDNLIDAADQVRQGNL